jgi:hypothetical protein
MRFSMADLQAAQAAGAIGAEDLKRLVAFLAGRQQPGAHDGATPRSQFDAAHLLWYAGALIVMGGMGMFSTLAFSQMGGKALAVTAIIYAIAFTAGGDYLWKRDLKVPGGLLITIAVTMAPLAVYGIQEELGWWGKFGNPGAYNGYYEWIKGSWMLMDAAAIAAGAVALRYYNFPFIVSVIAYALWFMSMDLVPWIFGHSYITWEERRQVSVAFGLVVIAAAWAVDYAKMPRHAFWLHLGGLVTFWGGLSLSSSGSELGKALYCLLNIGLLGAAIVLSRKTYAVFGALGVSMYLGYLASSVFKDSLLFPFALSLIGVAVLGSGLLYRSKQAEIEGWIAANVPEAILRLRPDHGGR